VGETGAGKSTIINLINGFYRIQKGEILIDGVDVNKISLKYLRKNISVVLQDVFLFSGTIRENIILNDAINDSTIENSLKISCSDTVVNSFHLGINEPVMERGATLSAGQRQLISFARAVAHEPSIFVLDEATANIDTHTEKLIQKAIQNIMQGRTSLIIAHRLSTIKHSDKIIVMKNGVIIESGNHEQLIKVNGYYKKLLNENTLVKV
jgi:ATP-binding cassette subfamily B protein